MLIIKLIPATKKAVTRIPLILCFRLLRISLRNVKKAPWAIAKPISNLPKKENITTGMTAAIVTFRALVK